MIHILQPHKVPVRVQAVVAQTVFALHILLCDMIEVFRNRSKVHIRSEQAQTGLRAAGRLSDVFQFAGFIESAPLLYHLWRDKRDCDS